MPQQDAAIPPAHLTTGRCAAISPIVVRRPVFTQPSGERVTGSAGVGVVARVALVGGGGRQQLGAQRLGEPPPRFGPGPVGVHRGSVGAAPQPTGGGTSAAPTSAARTGAGLTVAGLTVTGGTGTGRTGTSLGGLGAGVSSTRRTIVSAVSAVRALGR